MWATESAIKKPIRNEGLNLPPSEIIKIIDSFLKNLSQAFAEQSVGEIYAIVPKSADFYPDSAWTGCEYSGLTRNKRIEKTWKIGLDASDPAQFVFGRNSPAMGGCDMDPEYG